MTPCFRPVAGSVCECLHQYVTSSYERTQRDGKGETAKTLLRHGILYGSAIRLRYELMCAFEALRYFARFDTAESVYSFQASTCLTEDCGTTIGQTFDLLLPHLSPMAAVHPPPRHKDAWRVKSLRSTFGPQCLGHIITAPASGFGSSLRDSASKVLAPSEARL